MGILHFLDVLHYLLLVLHQVEVNLRVVMLILRVRPLFRLEVRIYHALNCRRIRVVFLEVISVHHHSWLVLRVAVLVLTCLLVLVVLLSHHVWRLVKLPLGMLESSHLGLHSMHPLIAHHLLVGCISGRVWVLGQESAFGKA